MTKRFLTPFQKFLKVESLSGILLLATTLTALFWANTSYGGYYESIWAYEIGIQAGGFNLVKPLILWINDGLMAVFFFLIGLEIKREVLIGELNSFKKIAFPLIGAIGGALVPVGLFMILNENPETFQGWGIPMATDIAFSLAVLNALGKKVPLSLKVFLIAFAIVDDIEAVLVIALFYSGTINMTLLLIGLGLIAILYFLSYRGFYSGSMTFVTGIVVWLLFLKSGVHPTVSGILLAFSIPIRQRVETSTFITQLETMFKNLKEASVLKKPILSKDQLAHMDNLEDWSSKFRSPLQHLEHTLHGWVAYLIIPIFALANAGIVLSDVANLEIQLVISIVICLVLGKGLGIPLVVIIAEKLRLIQIPSDITKRHIFGVSFIAGIGFTMAIFIANLAFNNKPAYITSAKVGILIGSLLSAVVGYLILKFSSKKTTL